MKNRRNMLEEKRGSGKKLSQKKFSQKKFSQKKFSVKKLSQIKIFQKLFHKQKGTTGERPGKNQIKREESRENREKIQKPDLKKVLLIGAVCILLPIAAEYSEGSDSAITDGGVARGEAGTGEEEYELILNAEGLPEDYEYSFSVDAALLTDAEIQDYFEQAKEEIDASVFEQGQTAECVTNQVSTANSYADGMVSAEWSFSDYDYIDSEGILQEDVLPAEGVLIEAEVTLTCQEEKDIYTFAFQACPQELSGAELLLKNIRKAFEEEQLKAGTTVFTLPVEVDGITLYWSEMDQHMGIKMALFEVMILILLYFTAQEKKKEQEEERRRAIEMDYSEIVSKISILMGSGMSVKSAWKLITSRYEADQARKKHPRPAYEEMEITMHEIEAGVTEHIAFQKFGERTGVHSFLRFSRLIVQNQQKGTQDLCALLQQESEKAFEERKLLAKKQGEEASTRMLMPMMIMMGIVIAIVITPAMLSFNF